VLALLGRWASLAVRFLLKVLMFVECSTFLLLFLEFALCLILFTVYYVLSHTGPFLGQLFWVLWTCASGCPYLSQNLGIFMLSFCWICFLCLFHSRLLEYLQFKYLFA
jgi:hypothetical protein